MMAILVGGCSLAPQKSGIEIISSPEAKVFLNGKEAGMTPYKNNNLKPGEIEVRLQGGAGGGEWRKTVRLENYSDTVIERDLSSNGGGYVLTLEKNGGNKSGLLLNATPDTAAIHIDGEIKGFSPIRIDDIGSGDKQIMVSFPTYKSRTMFVKGISGYQLVVDVDLASEPAPVVTATPTLTPTEEIGLGAKIMIMPTEVGFLRVRKEANMTSSEVGRVKPGETYDVLSEVKDWYQIKISETVSGWVSANYVHKQQ